MNYNILKVYEWGALISIGLGYPNCFEDINLAERCSKCGQLIQVSDAACWHCGAVLQGGITAVSPTPTMTDPTEENEAAISFRAVIFYAIMTAVCLILMVVVVIIFKQRPLFAYDPSIQRPPGWTAVTNDQQQFTFNLPKEWAVIERQHPNFSTEYEPFAQIIEASAIKTLVQSTQPNLLAIAPNNSYLMIFPLLSATQGERQTTILNNPSVQTVQPDQNVLGDTVIIFDEVIDIDSGSWGCTVHLIENALQAYAVVGCGQADIFAQMSEDFDVILTSFQPLLP